MVTKIGTAAADTLNGTSAADVLSGLAGNDALFGSGSNDIINGGVGRDTMRGGAGNDTYFVNQSNDLVIELGGQGVDVVKSTASFTLGANVENLVLIGSAALTGRGNALANTIIGNAGSNHLFGLGGNDSLLAGAGNDTIDGGLGRDAMRGGTGNDTYVVNQSNDVVVELAGQGTDIVRSAASFTLSANVEDLRLIGSAAINGTGNSLANEIFGNAASNILNGGAGNDTLWGNAGDDTLIGGGGSNELHPGIGNDIVNGIGGIAVVSYQELESGVTVDLAAGLTGGAAGVDTLIGITRAYGSSAGDTLTGGNNTTRINGGFGDDKLYFGSGIIDAFLGDEGSDELHGSNANQDFFGIQFGLGADTFFDFQQGTDKIFISGESTFNIFSFNIASFFTSNDTGQATTTDQRLIFEKDTHILWADLDGTGTLHEPIEVAIIPGVLLTPSDFE